MKKNWVIAKENLLLQKQISEKLEISPITSQVLINRGIEDELQADAFINPRLTDLPSPLLMKDMEKAVNRLYQALRNGEITAIYGDYDVDGITSTSLFFKFLKGLGMNVLTYNPDRLTEGYGINSEAVDKLSAEGATLIISGDCGITAYEEVEYAKGLGIDFIITDHHRPPDKIPEAFAVLNPHQEDCGYPAKEITGVGVIFNLAIAFRKLLRDEGFFKETGEPNLAEYLDLVALGTVADCAPVTAANRVMVKQGLLRMKNPKRTGIRALKEVSRLNGDVNSYDLGFRLGPRINAAGRLRNPGSAVDLLITDDINLAGKLASELNVENQNRQTIEKQILEDAISIIEENDEYKNSKSLVLSSGDWHPGVIGIVASRLCDIYKKPAFLLSVSEDGTARGSGRSIEGVDLYTALSGFNDIFIEFGGHEQAAGVTINKLKIDEFRKLLELSLKDINIPREKEIYIDMEIGLDKLDLNLLNELESLEPYGIGNPQPIFLVKSVKLVHQRVFKDKHLGMSFELDSQKYSGIWFNLHEVKTLPDKINIVFTPEINYWRGSRELRLNIKDVCHGD